MHPTEWVEVVRNDLTAQEAVRERVYLLMVSALTPGGNGNIGPVVAAEVVIH